jgi:Putative zinc-finger/Photosynthesis system II assembly factor YCF48
MPSDDREEQFERALARHLRNASPDSACPDAEILAAYHERALPPEEMARVKEHLAGCARCQESLALVEQSEDVRAASVQQDEAVLNAAPSQEAPTPIRTMAPRPPWRWIVPVGALAAGVIVLVGVREIQTQRRQAMESVQVAQNRQAVSQAPAAGYKSTDQLRKEEPLAQKSDEESRTQNAPAPPLPKPASPALAGAAAKVSAPPSPAGAPVASNQKMQGFSGAAKPLPPPRAPLSSTGAATSRAMQIAAPPAADAAAPAGTAGNRPAEEKKQATVPGASETVQVTTAAPAAGTTSTSASTLNSSAAQLTLQARNVTSLLQLAAGDPRYLIAPGEKHAWRVGEAGKIERSTDRGKTWKLQKSGVAADLTAGSATSDKICWVIGKAGTVLLTTDGGKHWKQISSPITEDLGGIHATDAQHAAIWDVPNRKSFETTDGGATWNRTSKD